MGVFARPVFHHPVGVGVHAAGHRVAVPGRGLDRRAGVGVEEACDGGGEGHQELEIRRF